MGKFIIQNKRADADVEQGILTYHSELAIYQAMGNSPKGFVKHISRWAFGYADQVEQDYQLFCEWAESL
nr:DUF2252 domain-containing protein [Paenibacillus antibioticophila]